MTMTFDAGSGASPPAAGMRLVTTGLYEYSAASATQLDAVYVLLATDSSPAPAPLTIAECWQSEDAWYIISAQPIPDGTPAQQFVVKARAALQPAAGDGISVIVWLASITNFSNVPSVSVQRISGVGYLVGAASGLVASRLSLALQSGTSAAIKLETGNPESAATFTIYTTSVQDITLSYDGVVQTVVYPAAGWSIGCDLTGPRVGSLVFCLALDPGTLYQAFGCLLQYSWGSGSALQSLNLPLFPSVAPSPSAADYVAFELHLHPSRPFDAIATRLQIDRAGRLCGGAACQWVKNARALSSEVFVTNDGQALLLTPWDPLEHPSSSPLAGGPGASALGAGFAFSLGPAFSPQRSYLSPVGAFTVMLAGSPGATTFDLMPGLFAREFVRLTAGDRLIFTNNRPSFAAAFGGGGSPPVLAPLGTGLLSTEATTSWAMVWPAGASAQRGYFSQPSAAAFFGPPGVGQTHAAPAVASPDAVAIATAVDIYLSPLTEPEPFPLAPYSALFEIDAATQKPFNPDLGSQIVAAFELNVLTQVRHQDLLAAPNGPIAVPAGRSVPDPQLRSIANPQGLLIDLADDGSWQRITLARGNGPLENNALVFARTGGSPLPATDLSSVLTRDQLFLVATRPDPTWTFQDRIALGGFEFNLPLTASGLQPILIFKYDNRRTLRDLALDVTAWAEAETYVGDVKEVRQELEQAFIFAAQFSASGSDPFIHFNEIVDDPAWTGFIAFGVPVNGNGMPLDFQILLGGIPGELRAHHLGIQMNSLTATGSAAPFSIAQSSIFAVVAYQRDTASPSPPPASGEPQYDVDVLIAVLSNSALTELNVKVSLVLSQLFGRAVALTPEPQSPHVPKDAISIQGRYQRHGDTGRVTFTTTDPFTFMFPAPVGETRIIERVVFTGASLVPVANGGTSSPSLPRLAQSSPGGTQVTADFVLAGEIFFAQAPFPGVALDLFSYGTAGDTPTGLAFAGLATRIAFTLDDQGAVIPSSKTVTLLIDTLTPRAAPSAIRPDSLMASLPLKLSGFQAQSPGGKGGSVGSGAQAVNVLQLMPHANKPTTHSSPVSPPTPATAPYVTTSPTYGLVYTVSLGSLGSLSSASAGISASLTLAWGPSPTVPDNDAAAVLIGLPSLSGGYKGFELQGVLKTRFGDANLLQVTLKDQSLVYALLFGNIQLSVLGYSFPPGVLVDFLLFAGPPKQGAMGNTNNIAWLLSATTNKQSP
jgi:hypothetical protein